MTGSTAGDSVRRLLSRPTVFYVFLVALGLGIRLAAVPYLGTDDMKTDVSWGHDVNHLGLVGAYSAGHPGGYFPLAFQMFAFEVKIASWLDVSAFAVMKAVNLIFDLGTLAVLAWFLREHRLDRRYALYYWLHPFFLAIFWLGYVDPFLTFCAMTALCLLARTSGLMGACVAGVPLAAAALFKPQALTLLVVTALLIVVSAVVGGTAHRTVVRATVFLVPSGLAFLGYSLYFSAHGFGVTWLARYSLVAVKNASPALTAHMLNVWTPVASHYAKGGQSLDTVTGPGIYHKVGALIVALGFVLCAVFVTTFERGRELSWQVLSVMTFGALFLPFLGTRAHENHLFLGLTLTIVALAAMPSWPFTAALNVLLAVQFVNLVGLYGLGHNHMRRWGPVHELLAHYGSSAQVAAAWVAIVSFPFVVFFAARALVTRGTRETSRPRAELLAGRA